MDQESRVRLPASQPCEKCVWQRGYARNCNFRFYTGSNPVAHSSFLGYGIAVVYRPFKPAKVGSTPTAPTNYCPISSAGLERRSTKPEVAGSTPASGATFFTARGGAL